MSQSSPRAAAPHTSDHFKRTTKDCQAHYLEGDHKAIKYLWSHFVQNNCCGFKPSPGELPRGSSNFRDLFINPSQDLWHINSSHAKS